MHAGLAERRDVTDTAILRVLREVWGFESLRPMQGEAIRASLSNRDSLVVMPTGGGKSLCYQLPALLTGKLTLVVSPLIALMQDQVGGLRLAGYPAAALHGHVPPDEAACVRRDAESGTLRLLLVAPERLLHEGMISWLRSLGERLGSIAIDEAHCISQWGHDFRPEYRRLVELRRHFPALALHAYTATATPRVRVDVAAQLELRDPAVLVGRFDRPNLTYRVIHRVRMLEQVEGVLRKHRGRAAIVYCIRRKDTEALAGALSRRGFNASSYHAGMTPADRSRVSEDFRREKLDIVVATVAFGMGIDRSDVRCVVHAGAPKSVEHYQQETGRAGRDGLPAECVLLYSGSDIESWRGLMEKSHAQSGAGEDALRAQLELLRHMRALAGSARCRHRVLSEYFGQAYEPPEGGPGCGACDVCLGELQELPDAPVVAQKIISCVFRVGQGFGAGHVADVLRGRVTDKVARRGHDALSTFGLLRHMPKDAIVSCVHQLVDAGALEIGGEYPVVKLTGASKGFLNGSAAVRLLDSRRAPTGGARRDRNIGRGGTPRGAGATDTADGPALSAEEARLFDSLRAWRRLVAEELSVPPYVVFGDATLEELCRVRPGSRRSLLNVRGIGNRKLDQFGDRLLEHVSTYCREHAMTTDARAGTRTCQPWSD